MISEQKNLAICLKLAMLEGSVESPDGAHGLSTVFLALHGIKQEASACVSLFLGGIVVFVAIRRGCG